MKIALIAMSGVRAFNEELTRLGMTLPGFAERGRTIASLPSLSLLTLAGMTPDRFEISYHEIADLRHLGELPPCDLAAISTMTAQVKDAYELARRYRKAGTKTVIGGLHATALPDEALCHFDTVVVGEGELSWPSLLHDFEAGRSQRLYRPRGQEFNLDDAPMPRFELLDPGKYNRLTVQTQRGCPWRCEFCASSITLTSKYKLKSIPKVIGEIRAIKAVDTSSFKIVPSELNGVKEIRLDSINRILRDTVPARWAWKITPMRRGNFILRFILLGVRRDGGKADTLTRTPVATVKVPVTVDYWFETQRYGGVMGSHVRANLWFYGPSGALFVLLAWGRKRLPKLLALLRRMAK